LLQKSTIDVSVRGRYHKVGCNSRRTAQGYSSSRKRNIDAIRYRAIYLAKYYGLRVGGGRGGCWNKKKNKK